MSRLHKCRHNIKKFRHNITREEQITLKEIRNCGKQTIRIHDKGSRFVILDNSDYEEKVQYKKNRSSFQKITKCPNNIYAKKVNTWIEKWYNNKIISEKWKKFITSKDSTPGKMYLNVNTHKIVIPTRFIKSGCNTFIENLSILYKMCFMTLQVN